MKLLSFVIPAYKSANTIKFVVNEIKEAVMLRQEYNYEIIIVNDCSPDNLSETLAEIVKENPKVKVINLAKNAGQHNALMAGYANTSGDIIISLDDDGQTSPSETFKLIDKLNEGFDVVFARYPRKKHSFFRNSGSKLNDLMARWLLGKPKKLFLSSFFAAERFVINEILKYHYPYTYVTGLILRTTGNIANVDVEHKPRKEGKTTYSFKKLISLWLNGFTAFSVKPLRISLFFGIIFALLGFAFGITTIVNKIISPSVPAGWSSTATILGFGIGFILILLGLLGEYIGRIYLSINNNPQYVIKSKITAEPETMDTAPCAGQASETNSVPPCNKS